MINYKDIPERRTVRFRESTRIKMFELSKFINEDDIAKIIDFSVRTALKHINFVTDTLVDPDWEVIFQRKRKTQKTDRRLY